MSTSGLFSPRIDLSGDRSRIKWQGRTTDIDLQQSVVANVFKEPFRISPSVFQILPPPFREILSTRHRPLVPVREVPFTQVSLNDPDLVSNAFDMTLKSWNERFGVCLTDEKMLFDDCDFSSAVFLKDFRDIVMSPVVVRAGEEILEEHIVGWRRQPEVVELEDG